MGKILQKTYVSFFHIMLQFCSADPGSEKELDSGLCWVDGKIKVAFFLQKKLVLTFGCTKKVQRCWNDLCLGSWVEIHWGYIPEKKSRNKTILKNCTLVQSSSIYQKFVKIFKNFQLFNLLSIKLLKSS